jgi:hypothetical protein
MKNMHRAADGRELQGVGRRQQSLQREMFLLAVIP